VDQRTYAIYAVWFNQQALSYFLVIYYQNVKSYGGGMLTVLSNRDLREMNLDVLKPLLHHEAV
jgi:hypothetical protein